MVTGAAELHAKLEQIPNAIRDEVVKVMEASAAQLVAEMKALVPVETGALRNSIGWTWGDAPKGSLKIGSFKGAAYGKLKITIFAGSRQEAQDGSDPFYAAFQEFGTVKMPANPFFFPVFRANKSRIKGNITRAVNRAFKNTRL